MKLEMKKLSSGRLGVLLLTLCTIVGVLLFIRHREINSGSEWISEIVQEDYDPIVLQWVCYDDSDHQDDTWESQKIKPKDAVYVWDNPDTDFATKIASYKHDDFKSNPQDYIVHNHCVKISIPNNRNK